MGDILLIEILPWKPVALRIKIKIWFKKIIYVWLHWLFIAFAQTFSNCGEQGLFIVVHRLPTAVASLVLEHRL